MFDSTFHDGSLDGYLASGDQVDLFLTAYDGQKSVLRLRGVLAMRMENVRGGSSIFDVLLRKREEIDTAVVKEIFGFKDDEGAAAKLASFSADTVLLEVNSSYGASCLVIASSAELIGRAQWLTDLSK